MKMYAVKRTLAAATCCLVMVFCGHADIVVSAAAAQQRNPWSGLVDIVVTIQGESNDVAGVECAFVATNSTTKAAISVVHITRNGEDSGSGKTWTRKFIWDAEADVGAVKIGDVSLTVEVKLIGVQLWEDGPYWATCNLGATKPEEYGYYFWWGDTVGYKRKGGTWKLGYFYSGVTWVSSAGEEMRSSPFSSSSCPTYDKSNSQLLTEDYIDSTGKLVAAHDAATAHLGAPWRMPTDAELSALVNNCDTEWTTQNGVSGRLVKGRGEYAQKSIFLPAAGYARDDCLTNLGDDGNFWSSTPYSVSSLGACSLYFTSGDFYSSASSCHNGHPVRPVRGFSGASDLVAAATSHLSIDCTNLGRIEVLGVVAQQRYPWNGLVDVTVTIQGTAEEVADTICTFAVTNSVSKTAIPARHISRNEDDVGSGNIWTRKFIWDAKADVGAFAIDDVALTVTAKPICVQLWEDGPYWAECNVGATKPEECGYYFWWGDTVGYMRNANDNGWISVKDLTDFTFSSGSCPTYGKNNSQLQSEGYIDSAGNLVAAHDAATAHLGAPWRMPTDAEFSALFNNCDTKWTSCNGVSGFLVKGRGSYTSKSIFLPAAGYGYDSGLRDFGSNGVYWPSSLSSDGLVYEYALTFLSHDFDRYTDTRSYGESVRPVRSFPSFVGRASFDATTHLSLDCRAGAKVAGGLIRLIYDASWYPNGVAAKLMCNGQEIVAGVAGNYAWVPPEDGAYFLTLIVFDAVNNVVGMENVWCLSREDMTSLVIPDGTTEIGENAFVGCRFTSVTIPNSVTNVAPTAFAGCTNIAAVDLCGSIFREMETEEHVCDEPEGEWIDLGNGQYRSKAISDNGSTEMRVHLNLERARVCSFKWKVSSESGWDKLMYLVDGAGTANISGLREWETQEVPLSAGEHTIVWRYYKDSRDASGEDCGWVDLSELLALKSTYVEQTPIASLFPDSFAGIESVVLSGFEPFGSTMFAGCAGLRKVVLPAFDEAGESPFPGCSNIETVVVSKIQTCWHELKDVDKEKWVSGSVDGDYVRYESEANLPSHASTSMFAVYESSGEPLTFRWGVSANYDTWQWAYNLPVLSLYVDGKKAASMSSWSAKTEDVKVSVDRGQHSLEWRFESNDMNWQSENTHQVYVDSELFPGRGYGSYKTVHYENSRAWIVIETAEIRRSSSATMSTWFPDSLSAIRNVEIGDKIDWLPDHMFDGCVSMEALMIPPNVLTIGASAFAECNALVRVDIPCISNWVGMRFANVEANPLHTGAALYVGGEEVVELVIPDGTTEIGEYAFAGGQFTSVTIPGSVTNVAATAFVGCENIVEVSLGIGLSGESECTLATLFPDSYASILSVRLDDGFTEIGRSMFAGCASLEAFAVPPSATRIWADAFLGCDAIERVDVASIDQWMMMEFENENANPLVGGATLYVNGQPYGTGASVVDGLTILDGWVIGCDDPYVAEIVVPDGVVGIGRFALADLYDLETVCLPSTLKYIASGAFARDNYLDEVEIPDSVVRIDAGAFEDCSWMQTISVGRGVERVGSRAFAGCTKLARIWFEDGLTEIGDCAFSNCWRMMSASLPLSVANVATTAFKDCDSLTGVNVPTSIAPLSQWFAPVYRQIRDVTIPSGETLVCSNMFKGCSSLVSVDIPEGVTNIGDSAFEDCVNLPSVELPSSLQSVGESAFRNCDALMAIGLPDAVSSIGTYAFYDCYRLKDVSLSKNLESLPDHVFDACPQLDSIYVPASVTQLGSRIFGGAMSAVYFIGDAPAYDADVYASTGSGLVTYVKYGTKGWDGRPNSRDLPQKWPTDNSYGRSIMTWDPVQFDVTFDAGEGVFHPVEAQTYACEQIMYTAYSLPPFNPVRKGYKFAGWWTEAVGGAEITPSTGVKSDRPHTLYAHWNEISQPIVIGDEGATVSGDAESGFVIKPSVGITSVEVTIPLGVDAAKVTVEVTTKVASVKPNGAKVKVVVGEGDITNFLVIPESDGVLNIAAATVKEEIVKETLDPSKDAVIELNAANPRLTTAPTRKGLTYTLYEGQELKSLSKGDSKLGDGNSWTPTITVSGGNAAFYSIDVTK